MAKIAFIGYARSGKDTAADILVEEYGFTRFAFADKLRNCAYALNPLVGTHRVDEGSSRNKRTTLTPIRLQNIIDERGWDGYKESIYGDEIRGLLQRMGTEVGRDLIDENIWVSELDKVEGNVVITDCRFWNEHNKIANDGGKIIRIHRAGINPVNQHISETVIDEMKPDMIIRNDGELEEFQSKIREIAEILV